MAIDELEKKGCVIFTVYCVLNGLNTDGFVSPLTVTCAGIVGVEIIQRGLDMAYMTRMFGNLLGILIIDLLQITVF